MIEMHIGDQNLQDTVSRLISLCSIPAENIIFLDEKYAGEHTHSADFGIFVLYQNSGYMRSALHRNLLSAYGGRYRAMPTPLDYSAFCKTVISLSVAVSMPIDSSAKKEDERPEIIEDGCTLTLGETTVHLTEREMKLFVCLRENCGTAVSREVLRESVWENTTGEGTNVVDVYVSYLRRKLIPLLGEGAIISVRGQGYILNLK
ncbi:MAG: winged helix-turn-helix transcriptional regulator [Clostridia bacterium]|nr:winged helix-turn-helix transcriptional regulator [Clostridia bacterium]